MGEEVPPAETSPLKIRTSFLRVRDALVLASTDVTVSARLITLPLETYLFLSRRPVLTAYENSR